jgi:hypothetical protein
LRVGAAWFLYGQVKIWNITACDDQVYDNITRGAYGCMTDSEGYITCNETPRPGCCFAPMLVFAEIYSIIVFTLLGVACCCSSRFYPQY